MAVETDETARLPAERPRRGVRQAQLEVERRWLEEKRDGLDHKRYADTFRAARRPRASKARSGPSTTDDTRRSRTRCRTSAPERYSPAPDTQTSPTTQRYIDLAGVLFRDEADVAEARMFGIVTPVEEDG